MSFSDSPKVDNNSERCEESINYLRLAFTRKNGFIMREEYPDYGVDFDVELLKNQQVTGGKFAIQAKSTKQVKKITKNGKHYIQYQMETSRIGYLSRRVPGYGIITLYDESTSKTFYDFIENIINRIEEQQNDDSWKKRDTISISIPLENELTTAIVKDIHTKCINRHENSIFLVATYGEPFSIPSYIDKEEFNEKNPINILTQLGESLINLKRFSIICNLVEKSNYKDIIQDARLCIYAVLSFSETGNVIEASRYLQRANQHKNKLNEWELEILVLISYKIKFISGELSLEEYGALMEKLIEIDSFSTPINKVNVKIYTLLYGIYKAMSTNKPDIKLEYNLVSFFDEIDSLQISTTNKDTISIQHINSISDYIVFVMSITIARNQTIVAQGLLINTEETYNRTKRCLNLENLITSKLKIILSHAIDEKDNMLIASLLLCTRKIFLKNKFNILLFDIPTYLSEQITKEYQNIIESLTKATALFLNEKYYKESHLALNLTVEIKNLFRILYSKSLNGESIENLVSKIQSIEKETGIKPYVHSVHRVYQEKKEIANRTPQEYFKQMDEAQIDFISKCQLEIQKLPLERLTNITLEIKGYHFFYQNCQDTNIEILVDNRHLQSTETAYSSKPIFVLRNKESNIMSQPSESVEELLAIIDSMKW